MAHITKHYISKILKDMCKRLSDVAERVFPEHRPSALSKQTDNMIVVSLPIAIDDQNAWQKTTMRIEIFVRNRSSGISPTRELEQILNAVLEKFPIVSERYSVTNPKIVLKGDDGLGFTVWNIQAKLLVNTTDSYSY